MKIMNTTYKVTNTNPFTVQYTNGESVKTVVYETYLLPREIEEELPHVVFDAPVKARTMIDSIFETMEKELRPESKRVINYDIDIAVNIDTTDRIVKELNECVPVVAYIRGNDIERILSIEIPINTPDVILFKLGVLVGSIEAVGIVQR